MSIKRCALRFYVTRGIYGCVAAAQTVLVRRGNYFPNLISRGPGMTLLVIVMFARFAPNLITIRGQVFFRDCELRCAGRFIRMYLAFLGPITRHIFEGNRTRVYRPLIGGAGDRVLCVGFVNSDLRGFEDNPDTFGANCCVQVTFEERVTPLQLFAELYVVGRLGAFFHGRDARARRPCRSPFGSPAKGLYRVKEVLYHFSNCPRHFVAIETVKRIAIFPKELFWLLK